MALSSKQIFMFSMAVGYLLLTVAPESFLIQKFFNFLLICIISLTISAFYSLYLYPFYLSPLRNIPTVKGGNWLIGQFWKEITLPKGHLMKDWTYSTPNDGLLRYLGLFNSETLIITSRKGLSEALITNCYDYAKPPLPVSRARDLLGDHGLVMVEGDIHKSQRRVLNPAFSVPHVKSLYTTFWKKSKEAAFTMTDEVKRNLGKTSSGDAKGQNVEPGLSMASIAPDQAVIDGATWASRATLDIIGIATAEIDFNAIGDPNGKLLTTYKENFEDNLPVRIVAVLSMMFPASLVKMLPFKCNRDIATGPQTVRGVSRDLLHTKKQLLEKKKPAGSDILTVALESGAFSEDILLDQIMTFLAAGSEPAAATLTWALYMICLYPAMQTRLRAEIRSNLPSLAADIPVTSRDIDGLPYLNAFVNEVVRYWCPITFSSRIAAKDTTLIGQCIPKGTRVIIPNVASNRDPENWGPTAAQFDPERWITSPTGGARSNFAQMTYLQGPRMCIGVGFSKAEISCLLGAWVGRFEFEFNDTRQGNERDILPTGAGSIRPRGGMWMKTRIVDGW